MTPKTGIICLKFSLFTLFLLFFQTSFSQNKFSTLDQWMQDNLKAIGGRAVLMVWKDGKVVYSNAINEMSGKQKMIGKFIAKRKGLDSKELLKDFDEDTRQRVASCSKWFSAALVMTFIDEGKLKLDDTVGKFLPVMTANGKGNITIWQCLSHLTGIQAGSLRESIENMNKTQSMDEAINMIAALPMEGEPGKTFHYSNAGLQIAAAVIEKISGKDFETLFAERICKPLGLTQTDFGKKNVPLAAGGAWSTPTEYLKFLQMILNEGEYNGKRILSKESIIAMQKSYVTKDARIAYSPAEAGNWGYGFGEWVMDDATGDKRSLAVTSPGLFGSFPWVDNARKYCAILFTMNINSKGRGERYKALKKLVDDAVDKTSR
ncbi:MAG: class A beta-lactamase-related serine hydrolase [Sphingobacteriales bacterium]|nr:MAG: class A beta-lactamase-related serine hydrolase [Sphingobacteriales bacterium]